MKKLFLFIALTTILFGCSPTHNVNSNEIANLSKDITNGSNHDLRQDQYDDYKNSGGELDFFEWEVEILGYHPGVSAYDGQLVVYFMDGDRNIISYSLVNKGEPAVYNGGKPTKSENNENGIITKFVFSKWDKDFFNVQHNLVVHALFDEDPRKYFEVRFEDYDRKLLSLQTIPDGGIPKAPDSPSRQRTKNGHIITDYKFSGWDKEIGSIDKPTTFTATYKESVWEGYTVVWLAPDGTVLKTDLCKKGSRPVYANEGDSEPYYYDNEYNYIFESWDKVITNLTDDVTIKENAIKIPLLFGGDTDDNDSVVSDERLKKILCSIAHSYSIETGIITYGNKRYYINANGNFYLRRPYKWHLIKKTNSSAFVISVDIMRGFGYSVDFNELDDYLKKLCSNIFADDSKLMNTKIDNSLKSRLLESSDVDEPDGFGKMFLLSAEEFSNYRSEIKSISEHTIEFMTRSYCKAGVHFMNVDRDWNLLDSSDINYYRPIIRPCVWFSLD